MKIARRRLYNQLIASASPRTPGDVVKEMGAVQAQDYAGALWAVGLRSFSARAEGVEQALADKAIIRTWPMRGTLHFVAPEDVRWMLAYLTPRVLAKSRGRFQQLELDEATFERSAALARNAMQGGERLVDGRIVGTWRRTLQRDSVVVEIAVLRKLTREERRAVSESAEHYGDFIGKNALVEIMT